MAEIEDLTLAKMNVVLGAANCNDAHVVMMKVSMLQYDPTDHNVEKCSRTSLSKLGCDGRIPTVFPLLLQIPFAASWNLHTSH